jgi:hypothetical protein
MAMTDEDKAYIKQVSQEAARILREDKILAKLSKAYPDDPPETDPENPDGGPKAPPKKPAPEPGKDKPRDRWWGEDV